MLFLKNHSWKLTNKSCGVQKAKAKKKVGSPKATASPAKNGTPTKVNKPVAAKVTGSKPSTPNKTVKRTSASNVNKIPKAAVQAKPSSKDVVITVRNGHGEAKKPVQKVVKKVVKKEVHTAPNKIDAHDVVIQVAVPRQPVNKVVKTPEETRAKRVAVAKKDVDTKREVLLQAGRAKKAAASGSTLAERFSGR